ncbi:MAG: hypothetical protein QNK37_33550 [Acidobacteriota bacterium]|nr:hypothetical protein [Acidobacteriota bacterium]
MNMRPLIALVLLFLIGAPALSQSLTLPYYRSFTTDPGTEWYGLNFTGAAWNGTNEVVTMPELWYWKHGMISAQDLPQYFQAAITYRYLQCDYGYDTPVVLFHLAYDDDPDGIIDVADNHDDADADLSYYQVFFWDGRWVLSRRDNGVMTYDWQTEASPSMGTYTCGEVVLTIRCEAGANPGDMLITISVDGNQVIQVNDTNPISAGRLDLTSHYTPVFYDSIDIQTP